MPVPQAVLVWLFHTEWTSLGFVGVHLFPHSELKHSLRLSTNTMFSPARNKVLGDVISLIPSNGNKIKY